MFLTQEQHDELNALRQQRKHGEYRGQSYKKREARIAELQIKRKQNRLAYEKQQQQQQQQNIINTHASRILEEQDKSR